MLTLPPHFRSRRREQGQEKARNSLECPWLAGAGCDCECITPSKEILFQNSMTFDVARPGLPEPSYWFLDLSSEQNLSRAREPDLSFTGQI